MFSSVRFSSARAERGAVLIEAAIAIPLLIFLIFGGIELGMAWESRSATTSGVRTGLLRTASLGDSPQSDLRTLQSIVGEIGADNVDGIEWVIIFNADTTDPEARIDQCAANVGAAGGWGIADLCTAYSTADLQGVADGTLTFSMFDDGTNGDDTSYTCDTSRIDQRFCAANRLISTNAINIGVAARYNHEWTTGIIPSDGVTYTEYAVSSTLTDGQANALTAFGSVPVGPTQNLAVGATATTPSTGWIRSGVHGTSGIPEAAFDGITDGNYNNGSVSHSQYENQPWLDADLGAVMTLDNIELWNRTDCCSSRLRDVVILVSDTPMTGRSLAELEADSSVTAFDLPGVHPTTSITEMAGLQGRYVRIQMRGSGYLHVAEVVVNGWPADA